MSFKTWAAMAKALAVTRDRERSKAADKSKAYRWHLQQTKVAF